MPRGSFDEVFFLIERLEDLDLIVRFSNRKSLVGLIALQREIAKAIGRDVDLHTEASISPYLQQSIAQDLQVIYGA